jgi:transcriptional regulator with XRE-family HTH domain
MEDPTAVISKKAVLQRKMVGVKVRHTRMRAGLTPKDVGQVLGLSEEAIADMEFGRCDVSLPQLEVMALIFNVPVIYFWSEEIIDEPKLDFPSQEAILLRQRIIGALLRKARVEAGRSQEELAHLLGLPTSKISDYEFGKEAIPLQELQALADYLKVSLEYFIDQGILPNRESNGHVPTLDEIVQYSQLPPRVRHFLSNPANMLYVNVAMKLSNLSAETLRALAEGLLEVTY